MFIKNFMGDDQESFVVYDVLGARIDVLHDHSAGVVGKHVLEPSKRFAHVSNANKKDVAHAWIEWLDQPLKDRVEIWIREGGELYRECI